MVSGVRAGRAAVRMDLDRSPLERSLNQVSARFKKFGRNIAGIGARVSAIGAGFTGLGAAITAPFAAATRQFVAVGDSLDKMSARTGLSASSLSELSFAAEQSGTDINQLGQALFRATRRIGNAASGTGPAVRALQELGLSAQDLSQATPEARFEALVSALGNVENEARRNQLAFEIFGDNFRQLSPLLAQGTDGIRALRQEARDLGLVVSDEDAKNAAALGDAMNRVRRVIGGAFFKVGAALAEPLTKAFDVISRIVGAVTNWIDRNRGLVQTIAAIGAGILAAGTVITAIGGAIVGIGVSIAAIGTAITTAFALASGIIGAILSPIGLVVAGIAAIGGAVLHATGSLQVLGSMFGSLGTQGSKAWQGIVDAVSAGNLELAGEIAFTALQVGWLTVTNTMQDVWNRVSDFFVNTWRGVVKAIIQTGAQIYTSVANVFDTLAVALQQGFDTSFVYIRGAIDTIVTSIAKAIIKAQEFFGLFSSEQSAQIQASLDDDLRRRAQGRQEGLDQRNTARAQGLSDRDRARQQNQSQFNGIVSQIFQRQRTETNRSEQTEAQKRLVALQEKLTKQTEQARKEAAQSQTAPGTQGQQTQQTALQSLRSVSADSVGSFNALAASQGAFSSVESEGQQQINLLSEIATNTKNAADEGNMT